MHGMGAALPGAQLAGEKDCLSWGMGDPGAHRQDPPGWGLSCLPSTARAPVCSVRIHLHQHPFQRQRPVGPDSPALPRAQQMGRPSPLPAAWPQGLALHPGCALQPPEGATPQLPGQGCVECQALCRGQHVHAHPPRSGHGAAGVPLPGSAANLPSGQGPLHTGGKCGGVPLTRGKSCHLGASSAVLHGAGGQPRPPSHTMTPQLG